MYDSLIFTKYTHFKLSFTVFIYFPIKLEQRKIEHSFIRTKNFTLLEFEKFFFL